MNTGIAILLELSTTTTKTMTGEFYLEFLIPSIVINNIDWRAFFSIVTSLSIFLFSTYLIHIRCLHDGMMTYSRKGFADILTPSGVGWWNFA